jgi:hypothetical protein
MSKATVFTDWDEKYAALWDNQPVCLSHRLHQSPLFTKDALAALIEGYPRAQYSIIHMGEQGTDRKFWREGDLGGLSGREVIDAIENGRLWLNLRRTTKVDARYKEMLDALFSELQERIPGFKTLSYECGILISSPNAQVYYHADLPGQALIQILGRKRVYFYPPQKPFLPPEQIEHIAVSGLEVDIPYASWYDDYARVFEFEPGQMVHWPLNAPHRIENHNSLNVSVTIQYQTESIRRRNMVTVANGILRYRLGWTPRSYATTGPSFWTKAVMQKAVLSTPWLRKPMAAPQPIEFQLDRKSPGAIIDRPVSQKYA